MELYSSALSCRRRQRKKQLAEEKKRKLEKVRKAKELKIRKEREALREQEKLMAKLETEELALIDALQRSQIQQRKAYKELETMVAT